MRMVSSRGGDSTYQAMMENLIREVFGFSFAPWFSRGLWDERYESHAFVEDGRMLSNISLFKSDLVVAGKRMRAHQFGGVATRKEARGKGLSRELMEQIIKRYPETPSYLATHPGVADFYPRFGFRKVETFRPEMAIQVDHPEAVAHRLEPDDPAVTAALETRGYSEVLDSVNAQPIRMFHLLMDYPDGIYRLPGCGAIVVAEQKDDRLMIADVLSARPIAFDTLQKELPFSGVRTVDFGFCPEWLGVTPDWKPVDGKEEPFFLRGSWDLPARFVFPVMAET